MELDTMQHTVVNDCADIRFSQNYLYGAQVDFAEGSKVLWHCPCKTLTAYWKERNTHFLQYSSKHTFWFTYLTLTCVTVALLPLTSSYKIVKYQNRKLVFTVVLNMTWALGMHHFFGLCASASAPRQKVRSGQDRTDYFKQWWRHSHEIKIQCWYQS